MESFVYSEIESYFLDNFQILKGLVIETKVLIDKVFFLTKEIFCDASKCIEKDLRLVILTFWKKSLNEILGSKNIQIKNGKTWNENYFIYDSYKFSIEKILVIFVVRYGKVLRHENGFVTLQLKI